MTNEVVDRDLWRLPPIIFPGEPPSLVVDPVLSLRSGHTGYWVQGVTFANWTGQHPIAVTGDSFVSVINCQFISCSFSGDGGAVYLVDPSLNATTAICSFISCYCSLYGGGLYFAGSSLQTVQCTFDHCFASNGGSSLYAEQSANSADTLTLTDDIGIFGSCAVNTFCLGSESSLGSVTFERSNITNNYARDLASGVLFYETLTTVFQFCEIVSNHDCGTCILFDSPSGSASIRHLSVRSNTCTSVGDYVGMFWLSQSLLISESVIAGNFDTLAPLDHRSPSISHSSKTDSSTSHLIVPNSSLTQRKSSFSL
jgi:hypothetical protein